MVSMKYSVITFGCRVNQADSLGFEEALRARGAIAVAPEAADLVIVNTCSVTATADQGARQTIRRSAKKMRRAAEDAVGDVTQKVGDTFETAKQRVEEKIEEARGAIEMKRDQVARAVQAGREAAQQARSDLERRLAETKAAYQAGAQVARESKGKNA